jgi:hypothetical protein
MRGRPISLARRNSERGREKKRREEKRREEKRREEKKGKETRRWRNQSFPIFFCDRVARRRGRLGLRASVPP